MSKQKVLGIIASAMSALMAFVAMGVTGASAQSYTPPDDLVPTAVSSANLVTIFAQFMTNGAVLTVVLAGLAVGLFGSILRAIRKARAA